MPSPHHCSVSMQSLGQLMYSPAAQMPSPHTSFHAGHVDLLHAAHSIAQRSSHPTLQQYQSPEVALQTHASHEQPPQPDENEREQPAGQWQSAGHVVQFSSASHVPLPQLATAHAPQSRTQVSHVSAGWHL